MTNVVVEGPEVRFEYDPSLSYVDRIGALWSVMEACRAQVTELGALLLKADAEYVKPSPSIIPELGEKCPICTTPV